MSDVYRYRQFEYRHVHIDDWPESQNEYLKLLNELGAMGWRRVTSSYNQDYMVFEREVL